MYNFTSRILLVVLSCGLFACSAGGKRQASLDQADRVVPVEVSARFETISRVIEKGETELAQRQLKVFVVEYPQYPGAWLNLALLTAADGDTPAAIQTLESGIQNHPPYAPGLTQLGVWYREAGRFEDAVQAYQAALDADPDYGLAAYNLGVYYDLYQQQPERALGFYERYAALQLAPDKQVQRWIADLQRRVVAARRARPKGEFE
ncbi:MAG: tetratricopeptide repeat protein [Gammaproteobacteria bacterium]